MKALARIALLLVLAALLLPAIAAACPNCKDALAESRQPGGSADLGRGFYWSILLMIAVPFSVVATVTGLILRAHFRRRRAAGSGAVTPLVPHSRGARS